MAKKGGNGKVDGKTLARAKKGDGDAILAVGCAAYTNGNYEKAMKCYETAAAKGVTQALVNLGYCHYYGRVTPVNYEKAFQCFSKAVATDGDVSPEAYFKLGDMYLWGNYVEKDAIGRLWAAKSGGKCLYATVYKSEGLLDVKGQLDKLFGGT